MDKSSEETELTQTEKYYLSRFLEKKYDFSMEKASSLIDNKFKPKDWTSLEFTKDRMFSPDSSNVYMFSDEFNSHSQILQTLISTHLCTYPRKKEAYISQQAVPEGEKFRLRKNPNIIFSSYMPDEDVRQFKDRLEAQVKTLRNLLEEEEIPAEYKKIYQVIFSIYLYTINEKETLTDMKNINNAFRKIPNKFGEVIEQEINTAYRNVGRRLDIIFEEPTQAADKLVTYYPNSVSELVKTIEKANKQAENC